jgi:lysophospholipase L1-like esterase
MLKIMFSKNKPIKIVTIGDSLTQGNPPPHSHHPGQYQYFMLKILTEAGYAIDNWNCGIGGQIMNEIAVRIPGVMPTDIIAISGGTNDCWRYSNFDEEIGNDMIADVLENMQIAINNAKKGSKVIILCSIPATIPGKGASPEMLKNIIKARPKIEKLAKDNGIYFCDIYKAFADEKATNGQAKQGLTTPDGVHFIEKGNQAFGECLGKCILKIIESQKAKI